MKQGRRQRAVLLSLLLPAEGAALRLAQPRSCSHATTRLFMSAAADEDDAVTASDDAVVVPDKFPTFGLSERQQLRLSCMFTRDEPLMHEIIGLQVLFGAIGSRINGAIGFILGFFQVSWASHLQVSSTLTLTLIDVMHAHGLLQVAPFFSIVPGRCGDSIRALGYMIYTAVAWTCDRVGRVSRYAQHRVADLERAWSRAELERRRWAASIAARRDANERAALS